LEDKSKIKYVRNKYDNAILISAARGINISEVNKKLIEFYENNHKQKKITLNATQSKIISQIHSMANVLSIEYIDDKVEITFKADKANYSKLEKIIGDDFG